MRRSRSWALVLAWAAALLAAAPVEAAPLPKLPTELVGKASLEVRPPVVSFTGDGTGYLGGFTGRKSIPPTARGRSLRSLGHLRWSTWTPSHAVASGAAWLNDGIPDDASGTFYPYSVTVHAYRPRSGIFTRLAFAYWIGDRPYAVTRSATFYPATQYGPGYWQWY